MAPNDLIAVTRLSRDLTKAATTLSATEARYLVDAYYQMQEDRLRTQGRLRSMSGEPHLILNWLELQSTTLEDQVKKALDKYTSEHPIGQWLRGVTGIGPVIAAGLLAHIDIEKAPTAGHIWRYAGLDPTKKWEKGQKRPWNATLKVLCYKAGESFVKVQNNENDVYGKLYKTRKDIETAKNEAGEYAAQAAAILASKRIGADTEAYKAYSAGKLPKAHIHARARRWAVKLFLSHLHAEMYRAHFGKEPPAPFAIAILGHAHMIEPAKHGG